MEIKKKTIFERIFNKRIGNRGENGIVRFSDLPSDIQPNDVIQIIRDDGFYSENNSWDAYTCLEVHRERPENDEEYKKRMARAERDMKSLQERRYQTYLKLKKEFDGNEPK